jgi:hypothetical protein
LVGNLTTCKGERAGIVVSREKIRKLQDRIESAVATLQGIS